MSKASEKLCIKRKNDEIQEVYLYTSLADTDNNCLGLSCNNRDLYAQLGDPSHILATKCMVKKQDGTKYALLKAAPSQLLNIYRTFSGTWQVFYDGGSFPGTSYYYGGCNVSPGDRIYVKVNINVTANKGRSGGSAARIRIGNQVVWSKVHNAKQRNYSFWCETVFTTSQNGWVGVYFEGYKPKWHGYWFTGNITVKSMELMG